MDFQRVRALRRRALALTFGAAISLSSVVSLAGPDETDGYDASVVRAVAAKERALDADDAAHWEEALHAFEAARAIRETAEVSYEIGYAAQRLNRTEAALQAYEAALASGLSGPARTKADAFVAEHAARVAHVEISGPAGARVSVNGAERGTLPLSAPLVVLAGDAVFDLALGEAHVSRRVTLTGGERTTLDLEPSTETPPHADRSTETPPRDATEQSTTTTDAPPPNPVPGAAPFEVRSQSRTGAWILIGVGGTATLVGAVVVPLAYNQIGNERDGLRATCDILSGLDTCVSAKPNLTTEAQDHVDAIATWKALRTAAWVSLGTGVVTLVTGIALGARSSKAAPRTADHGWSVDLRTGPRESWLSVEHAF